MDGFVLEEMRLRNIRNITSIQYYIVPIVFLIGNFVAYSRIVVVSN